MEEARALTNINGSSKRRRLLRGASRGRCISDLPNGVLSHVASYLALPSRAFFAVALSPKHNCAVAASDERNTAIVGDQWSTLDFGDIEKNLAVRLSDGHIEKILLCIDAVNELRRLKLTNCVAITGECLEPLRGSTIIEQIDLSLVTKHQSPDLFPAPPISCDVVVPMLDSIIETEGCSLMHLQFPAKWRKRRGIGRVQFHEFLLRYNEMMSNRDIISCHKCSENLSEEDDRLILIDFSYMFISGDQYGIQHCTCCECLKYYCEYCADGSRRGMTILNYCGFCEREICADCQSSMKWCDGCEKEFCVDCLDVMKCSGCDVALCKYCLDCMYEQRCDGCGGYFVDDGEESWGSFWWIWFLILSDLFIRVGAVDAAKNATVITATRRQVNRCLLSVGEESNRNVCWVHQNNHHRPPSSWNAEIKAENEKLKARNRSTGTIEGLVSRN